MQLAAMAMTVGLALAGGPHYDVPRGYTRCPSATAWHGFFKWASEEGSTCQAAARFMRSYADAADGAPAMPRAACGLHVRNKLRAQRGRQRLREPPRLHARRAHDPLLRDGLAHSGVT